MNDLDALSQLVQLTERNSQMEGAVAVTRTPNINIHTYVAPEAGWVATSHLVELPSQLILVDTPLLPEHTREVLAVASDVGKTISRVYITHGHPDHYAGTGLVDAPSYALAPTVQQVNERGAAILKGAYALTGRATTDPGVVPAITHTIEGGEEVIDGVRFSFEPVEDAESAYQLTIGLPDESVLIAGDLVYNHVHAFIAERHFDGWHAALAHLEARPYDIILPGHGLPGDRRLYAGAHAYLTAARAAFTDATGPADLTNRLMTGYADYGGIVFQPVQNYYLYPPAK